MNTTRSDFIKSLFAVGAVAAVPSVAKAVCGLKQTHFIDANLKSDVFTTYRYIVYKFNRADASSYETSEETPQFCNYDAVIRYAAGRAEEHRIEHEESGLDVLAVIHIDETDAKGMTEFDLLPVELNGDVHEFDGMHFNAPRMVAAREDVLTAIKEMNQ